MNLGVLYGLEEGENLWRHELAGYEDRKARRVRRDERGGDDVLTRLDSGLYRACLLYTSDAADE